MSREPPLVLWSLRGASPNLVAFVAASHFTVNVLAESQIDLSRRFASPVHDRFAGADWQPGLGGAPVLSGCAAVFQCASDKHLPMGDHMLFIGRVFAVWLASRIVGETQRPGRAWAMVLGVTALQGLVGYTQYALKLPEVLVVTHMLLAALLIVALVNGLMSLRDVPREQPRSGRGA